MKIGVIGSKGFIGAYLAQDLINAGHEVISILRNQPPTEEVLDVVLDCNGSSKRFVANHNPELSLEASVAPVVKHLNKLNFSQYIYLSTIDVYGKGRSKRESSSEESAIQIEGLEVYGFHKYLAEQSVIHHCTNQSKKWLILRVGTVIGPGLKKNPVFDATEGLPIRMTPETTLSLVGLPFFAKVLKKSLGQGAEGILNVTSCKPIRLTEVLEETAKALVLDSKSFKYELDLTETQYDINVEKLRRSFEPPTSLDELRGYLKHRASVKSS